MSLRSEVSSVGGLVLPDADDFLAKLRTSKDDKEDKKVQDDSDNNDNSSPVKTRHNNDSSVKLSSKEIRYREKMFPVVKKVMRQELRCTACGTSLKQVIELGGPVYSHPLLCTLMCKNCLSYYSDGDFSVDEDGSDNYCRWCGQGGEMFCCTDCSCVFCKKCTKRNLSRSLVKEVEDSDDWKCFVCNVKPLWDLRGICWAVEEHIDDILKAKKEQTKQKLHLLSSKLKDSPEKPKKRRELKRVQKDSSDADSSDGDIKEKKTGRNKKNDSSNGDSDGSDNSRRSSSLVRRTKVSNKRRNVREKKKTLEESEIEELSSDSDFEETGRRKSAKKHSIKNLRARNMSRKAKKSSDSDSESNGRRKHAKRSTTRVSKSTQAVGKNRTKMTDEDSDSSDSDFEKPEVRRRPAPKSKRRPTRDSKPKSMKEDDIVSISDSSDENKDKKKKSVRASPIIRSRAEKEKHLKKVAVVDANLKKNKIRNHDVDDSVSEKSTSETDVGKNKRKPSIGNSGSIQKNGTINSKRKLDFPPNSKDLHVTNSSIDVSLTNGIDGSELHLRMSNLETSVGLPNSNLGSDSEKIPDLPMEVCSSQGSLPSDVILPTTIDEESELRAQALLQEQCLDLRILSRNLDRAAKQIQGRISTEDPAEIYKAIQKIQSLIIKTKENMDHQSSCLKHRGERWTRKVIAKAKVRAKKNVTKGKSVESHAIDSVDADKVVQRTVSEEQSNYVNLVGLSRENKKSKNVNIADPSGASNSEPEEDKNQKILDKENNILNSEDEVVSSKNDNVQPENEISKVIARKSQTSDGENGNDSNGVEDTLENGVIENEQEKLNGELSSQATQEYQLLLNDVSLNETIVNDTKKKRSRKSSVDLFTDEEEEEVINLNDTVNSLDLLGDLDATLDTDKKHTDSGINDVEEKADESIMSDNALKDKKALLESGLSDEEPLAESKEKGTSKKFTTAALKDKDALLASGSSDDEPLTEAKEKDAKKKFTTAALKDKDALLASGSSDDELLVGNAKKSGNKSKDNKELAESNASDLAGSGKEAAPKATPTLSKAKMGPKSRVHKSSTDDSSSLSDFDISVKKRKRRTDGKRIQKKRCVDVDLESFGDNKLTFDLTVNVVKLTEEDLHKHNIHEIPSCTAEGEKKRKRGGRGSSGDSSDQVKRLLDLKSLKRTRSARRRRSSAGSDSTASDASAENSRSKVKARPPSHIKKKKKREDDEQKLLDYIHKKFSDDSDTSDNDDENDNDSDKALKKSANAKKKLEMQKKLAAKQMLLDELMSSSEASDAAQSDKKEEKKKNTKKREKKEEKKEKVESDASDGEVAGGDDAQDEDKPDDEDDDKKKSDEESDVDDSSDTARKKKNKKKWRNNKLLRGKLSETDTSDDERKWDAKKKRGEKEKKDRKKPTRKVVASDSDSEAVAKVSSTSSSSDEDFFPSKKKKKPEPSKKGNRDSSDSDSDKPKKKVRRRRIKTVDTDSSGSNDEVNESQKSTPGKGRKNIRRVLKEDSVGEMTRKAAKEEEDRRLRILEKQKLYNQLYDNLQEGVVRTDKLVLDFDPETKKELVSVDTNIVQKLKPHQVKGVKFMWDACFESVKRLQKSPGSGCILAHCMGLGKTFQVVTLVHTLLTNKKTRVKRVLVICPLSTVLNWVNEFNMWLKDTPDEEEIDIFELSKFKQAFERSHQLKEWHDRGGVMVLSYDMFRNLSNPKQKRVRKSILDTYKRTLMDPGPDLVICDEGHLLKNEKTAISKAVGMVNTLRRIALTGTPLQNNLGEYHCMVQFVKPNLLGTKKEFSNRFINPITNGQFENSTVHDVKVMKRRAHVLHKMLEGCVQRFDYSVLTPFLPPKQEYVISVRLSDTQIKIYQHYLDHFAGGSGRGQNTKLFADFQYMQRIWTHPKVLMWNVEKCERLQLNKEESDSEGSLKDFVVESSEDSDEASSKSDEASKSAAEISDSDREEVVKKSSSTSRSKRLATRSTKAASPVDDDVQEVEQVQNNPLEWWKEYTKEEDFDDLRLSGKLVLFFSILRECEKIGDKVLVFSQSMFSLDLIEHFLSLIDAETQRAKKDGEEDEESSEKLDHHRGSWARGLDYFRLDGSVSGENRSIACKMFNKEDNLRARLYLISTKAGGLGINLFAANRVIIFDASWNPSHDVQSIFRVYRFGQKKPCYIYRFLASGTMEEKIYERQVTKLSLACRVVDEQQIERHYTSHDLQEMYTFNPEPTKRPTPILPKDRLLAELLKEHEKWIETYHEHDSLLENKCEEELNEDERKAAWDDYENEKKAPAQGLLNANQGMNNYLSYIQSLSPEAIREVLRKENPTATEEQITERVRLLMAAAYKHYEQQQNFNKQIQAYHALQNQQIANQVAFGGNAHPTALYLNNASAMPNTKMFSQGMLGSAGAGNLAGMLQQQQNTYAYQNMLMTGAKAATSTAGAQPFLKVRNFADMQEPAARPTFKTVPTIRPLNMKAGSSRTASNSLVKNPLFAAKTISKTPIILGKGGASSSSGPPKSPEVETIDSD